MSKVLITGVAGLTGSHLVRTCLEKGDDVVGVDDYFRGIESNISELFDKDTFTFYKCDFRNFIKEHKAEEFDEIYHLAAIVPTKYFYLDPELTYTVNCHGTYEIFKWAMEGSVKRFVNASSSEIYGHAQEIPTKENTVSYYDSVEDTSRWSYAHGKIITEYLLNQYKENIEVCHLRYANVYGPYDIDDNHVIPYILNCILEDKEVKLNRNADQVMRSFLYMSDCAEATYLAMKNMRTGESYNIGNPEEVTIQMLWDTALKIATEEFGLTYTKKPVYEIERAGDPLRRVLDITRAKEVLHYSPEVNLEEGLRRTLSWMIKQQ